MKILLANIHMTGFTGSETWTYTMAKYLSRKHEVIVMSPNLGAMSDKINELGVRVITNYEKSDLYLINHIPNFEAIPKEEHHKVIYTSHSKFYDVENLPRGVKCVCISKELQDHFGAGFIIPQPIDMERFSVRPINRMPKNILYLSNPDYALGSQFIKDAFDGYNVITIDKPVFDIEKYIYMADVVIAYGRGAFEALACGRNVIIGDWRGYTNGFTGGGMVRNENFSSLLESNLTGRNDLVVYTKETLRDQLKYYDPDRKIDMDVFNAENIVNNYLSLNI